MESDSPTAIEIPPAWEELSARDLGGTTLVIGASDSGKSTLVRYLVERRRCDGSPVGWIDGDPGQGRLGPPTTINLCLPGADGGERPEETLTFFVGSTSPRGHMLPALAGLRRLQEAALARDCASVIIDTSGLVAESAGGGALKEWQLELLRPQRVVALRRGDELEHLLAPLRRDRRFPLHELEVAAAVKARSPEERAARRRQRFRACFAEARTLRLDPARVALYGRNQARSGQILALLGDDGFTLALGVWQRWDEEGLEVFAPAADAAAVAAVRLGALAVDPETGDES